MREEMDPAAAARWIPVAADENLCRRYMEDLQDMCTEKASMKGRGILMEYGNLIFENGQGLLLDWSDDEEEAVYTTPSRTGLHDAAALIEDCFEGETAEACYVTRTYLTRHGSVSAGWIRKPWKPGSAQTLPVPAAGTTGKLPLR